MARFSRLTVYDKILSDKLVPLFYHGDKNTALKITDAVVTGGASVLEFTNRGDKALDVFKAIQDHRDAAHPELALGVGSVMDAPTAALYLAAGADFIVAPIFNKNVALLCNRRKIAYIPGCGSVTEISQAEEYGAEIVKIFPGKQVGGPGFIKAVSGPLPWSRMMPTGGVDATQENITTWLQAGACAVGMGSKLISKELVNAGDYDAIVATVKDVLGWIRKQS